MRLDDHIMLAGLIVTTKPFNYENAKLTANIEVHVTVESLQEKRKDLESMLPLAETDEAKCYLSDSIYFVDKVIMALEAKLHGNDI